jgi:hypothetical protein
MPSENDDVGKELKVPLPSWARLFLHVGFPSAVAIMLLAALFGWIPSPMMQTMGRMEYQAWQQSRILRAICYRLSTDAQERVDCEPWKDPTQ